MRKKIRNYLCIALSVACAAASLAGCDVRARFSALTDDVLQTEQTQEEGLGTQEAGQDEETETFGNAGKEETGRGKEAETNRQELHVLGERDEAAEQKEEAAGDDGGESGDTEASYADNYAYGTLDEAARTVYREALRAILEHRETVEVSATDTETLEKAYQAVCADYGGLFWVSGYAYTQYTRAGEPVGMDFKPKYTVDIDERKALQQQIDASVEELLAGVSIADSDYEKAKYVFEILVQNVDYDASVENNQNIISAFLSRATVCQGYACAAQYLLKLLGIQSAIVTGRANGESHAWNLVRLDGEYYYMDITWGNSRYLDEGSQTEKYVNYGYLAVTSEEIGRTHTPDDRLPLPDCTSMADNYFVREGRYFSEWAPEAIGALLSEAWNAGGMGTAVKFSSRELYAQAISYFIEEQHIADYCENITSIYYLEDEEQYILTFHLQR